FIYPIINASNSQITIVAFQCSDSVSFFNQADISLDYTNSVDAVLNKQFVKNEPKLFLLFLFVRMIFQSPRRQLQIESRGRGGRAGGTTNGQTMSSADAFSHKLKPNFLIFDKVFCSSEKIYPMQIDVHVSKRKADMTI
ncbi:hypothetical protein D917_08981, partial [Trichinella nativa]